MWCLKMFRWDSNKETYSTGSFVSQLTRICFVTKHCKGFARSSSSIHENRTIESSHDRCDNWFCANFKNLLISLLMMKNRIKLHIQLLLNAFCDIAMSLLSAMEEELILVLIWIKHKWWTVQNTHDCLLVLLLQINGFVMKVQVKKIYNLPFHDD